MQAEKKFAPTFHVFLPKSLEKEAFIHWTDDEGKRHRRKGGINRAETFEARAVAAQALRAKLEAEYFKTSSYVARMLEFMEKKRLGWRRKTYQTNKSKVDLFVIWLAGRDVSNETLTGFFEHLLRCRHKQTYGDYLAVFKRVFKWLGEPEMLDGIEAYTAISTPAKYFQSRQIERIKKHLVEADPDLWLACQFLYYCFIRPGELRLLKIGDIFFDENKICLRAEISKNKKQQYVTIPLAFRSQVAALAYRAPNEFVFFKSDCTKPLPINSMMNRFRVVLRALGFGKEYKFYSWKHTGAVACVRAGASLKELQIQLRHYSLEEVDRYIRQLGVNDLKDLEMRFPAI
jgi:integrase